jgi:hypothetical protein
MTVDPATTAVASPFELAAFEIVATEVSEELQVADPVRSWVVLSENSPSAENCSVDPAVIDDAGGVTTIEVNIAGVTVKTVDPDLPSNVAVIVAVPVATGVAKPFEPTALLTVATDDFEEPQVAVVVRFCVEPSV